MLCHAESAPCLPTYCLLARHCHWTLGSEWLGGRGHGLEAEFCHPIPFPIVLSILESRFSWAARRHRDWPRQAGRRSTNSNDAANRIRSHHHASLAWDGIQGAGRQPDMPGSIFNLTRIPDLENCPSGAGCPGRHPERTRVGSVRRLRDRTRPTVLFWRRPGGELFDSGLVRGDLQPGVLVAKVREATCDMSCMGQGPELTMAVRRRRHGCTQVLGAARRGEKVFGGE